MSLKAAKTSSTSWILLWRNPSLFRTAEPYISTPEISAAQLGEELQDLLAGKTHRKDSFWGRLKQAARAHRAGKAEMARIDAMAPSA